MSGIIGKKVGMTSIFDASGKNIPCTVIEAGPCVVTQVKTSEKDGYDALQIAYGEKKEKNTPKALKGHFKKADTTPKRVLAEFSDYENNYKLGDVITLDLLQNSEWVDVVGISNFVTFLKNTKEYRRNSRRAEYGDERDPEMNAFLEKISPNNSAQKITKPLFIVQGYNDPRVPVTEA